MPEKDLNFEEALKRLDEIVTHLERGDISLQESLTFFEEGSKLLAACNRMLEEAEQKVVQLRKGENCQPEELPFDD